MKLYINNTSFLILSLILLMPAPLLAQSPSSDTISDEDAAAVMQLIRSGADLNAVDEYGLTPLMTASRWGKASVVRLLLANGAKPDSPRTPRGRTPLIVASAYYSGTVVCGLLVENGADVNATADDGSTALMLAAQSMKITLVEYFLSKGADPNRKDNSGRSALDYARSADPELLGTSTIADAPFDKPKVIERLEEVMERGAKGESEG